MACKHFQCGGWGSSDHCSYRPNETTNVSSEVYDKHCRYEYGYKDCPWANGGSTARLSRAGECPYCYFNANSGWYGSYVCQAKNREIDRDTYHNYCEYRSTYGRCPNNPGGNNRQDAGGCYLTTACVEYMGLTDDCEELTVLRWFRDHWLRQQPCGGCEIAEYYATAPDIVDAIHADKDSDNVLRAMYNELVLPCVADIKAGRYEEAHTRYRAFVRTLKECWLSGK